MAADVLQDAATARQQQEDRNVSIPPETVIDAARGAEHPLRELWRARGVVYALARRDIAVRYKQTVFGVAWALVQPIAAIVTFSIVFGKLAGLPSGGVAYPLVVLGGTLLWQFFANALSGAANSLVQNHMLLQKVAFSRLAIVLAAMAVAVVDALVASAFALPVLLLFGPPLELRVLALPLFFAIAALLAFGVGSGLAALNAKFRDVRHALPLLIQIGLFISPVGFASDAVPVQWRPWLLLNPLSGIIDGCRWALFGTGDEWLLSSVLLSTAVALAAAAVGVAYFVRNERTFADVL